MTKHKDTNDGHDKVGPGINLLLKDESKNLHDSHGKLEFPISDMKTISEKPQCACSVRVVLALCTNPRASKYTLCFAATSERENKCLQRYLRKMDRSAGLERE